MEWIIDRINKEEAVVEDEQGTFFCIPIQALPGEAKEGDLLDVSVNLEKTNQRREHIQRKMLKIKKRL